MPERLRILFTEGASLSARQTLYPLGPWHDVEVIDPDWMCQCHFSSLIKRFDRSPSFSKDPEGFLRCVARHIRDRKIDVLLPTHEQVYILSRFRDVFTPHVGLALPDFSAMETMQNKARFSRLMTELNLPQPESTIIENRAELSRDWQYPFYLKLAHSTAGGGVSHIESPEALRKKLEELDRSGRLASSAKIVVQQPGKGTLSTVQAVFDHGRLVGIHVFESRRLGVGGMSTARTSADHPKVREDVELIGRHLEWHGALFIDYFYDRETKQPQYVECNPRIGETVNAMVSGINLPQLLVQVSRGESPPRAPLGRFGVRTHNLFMILMSAAYDGKGRGALLQEIQQYSAQEGLYENGQEELNRTAEDPLSELPRVFTIAQLLAAPGIARRIVKKTVENYALPESAVKRIKELPLNFLKSEFAQ